MNDEILEQKLDELQEEIRTVASDLDRLRDRLFEQYRELDGRLYDVESDLRTFAK